MSSAKKWTTTQLANLSQLCSCSFAFISPHDEDHSIQPAFWLINNVLTSFRMISHRRNRHLLLHRCHRHNQHHNQHRNQLATLALNRQRSPRVARLQHQWRVPRSTETPQQVREHRAPSLVYVILLSLLPRAHFLNWLFNIWKQSVLCRIMRLKNSQSLLNFPSFCNIYFDFQMFPATSDWLRKSPTFDFNNEHRSLHVVKCIVNCSSKMREWTCKLN